jgi:uncharacterized membrane protein
MSALVAVHALGASLALTLGGWQLLRRTRGDRAHRLVGRVWVVAMYWTVLSSFFIKQLDPGHFSWIHGLSAFTFLTLTLGTWAAIRGRIGLHRRFMRGSYLGLVGAFLGAVVVPQRDIPQLLVHRPLLLAAATVAVAVSTVTIVAVCTGHPGRRPHRGTGKSLGEGTGLPRQLGSLSRPRRDLGGAGSTKAQQVTSSSSPSGGALNVPGSRQAG